MLSIFSLSYRPRTLNFLQQPSLTVRLPFPFPYTLPPLPWFPHNACAIPSLCIPFTKPPSNLTFFSRPVVNGLTGWES